MEVCPYCKGEMIPGRLRADGRNGADLYWIPEGEDAPLWRTRDKIEKKGGILFHCLSGSPRLKAWRCTACKKMIIPYEKRKDCP